MAVLLPWLLESDIWLHIESLLHVVSIRSTANQCSYLKLNMFSVLVKRKVLKKPTTMNKKPLFSKKLLRWGEDNFSAQRCFTTVADFILVNQPKIRVLIVPTLCIYASWRSQRMGHDGFPLLLTNWFWFVWAALVFIFSSIAGRFGIKVFTFWRKNHSLMKNKIREILCFVCIYVTAQMVVTSWNRGIIVFSNRTIKPYMF